MKKIYKEARKIEKKYCNEHMHCALCCPTAQNMTSTKIMFLGR